MKMTEEEKRMLAEGTNDPDIVREGKAVMFFFIAVVCVVLICAVVVGAFWLISEIIKSLC